MWGSSPGGCSAPQRSQTGWTERRSSPAIISTSFSYFQPHITLFRSAGVKDHDFITSTFSLSFPCWGNLSSNIIEQSNWHYVHQSCEKSCKRLIGEDFTPSNTAAPPWVEIEDFCRRLARNKFCLNDQTNIACSMCFKRCVTSNPYIISPKF